MVLFFDPSYASFTYHTCYLKKDNSISHNSLKPFKGHITCHLKFYFLNCWQESDTVDNLTPLLDSRHWQRLFAINTLRNKNSEQNNKGLKSYLNKTKPTLNFGCNFWITNFGTPDCVHWHILWLANCWWNPSDLMDMTLTCEISENYGLNPHKEARDKKLTH